MSTDAMRHCDLTLATPAENLAFDEALLDQFEEGVGLGALRFWEPDQCFVVVGYGNRVGTEVNEPFCRAADIPILRRCSGGGTVLQGPGCLNYSVVLRMETISRLASISGANQYVLERNQTALEAVLQAPVATQGHTDLTLRGLKFAGNAQRRKRHCLLFHGVLLLDFDLTLIERALPMPSKQPDYRGNRSHCDFLVNLKVPAERIKAALRAAWEAEGVLAEIPLSRTMALVAEKYGVEEWHRRFV